MKKMFSTKDLAFYCSFSIVYLPNNNECVVRLSLCFNFLTSNFTLGYTKGTSFISPIYKKMKLNL